MSADSDRRFTPGRELAGRFYAEAVRPILDVSFAGLSHSAAILGDGSEVLAYDSPRSTDHDWGPRLLLFLHDDDYERDAGRISDSLTERLPPRFAGYPTNFGPPDPGGARVPVSMSGPPIAHRVEVHSVGGYMTRQLGFDPRHGVSLLDWLATPSQLLLTVVSGAVFYDGLGALAAVRSAIAWYPHDVWLYLLAAHWARVAQEEALVGRTAEARDDLGSRIVATRLVRDVMRLCFLVERRYAPYTKWLGTAFAELECAATLQRRLEGVLAAADGEQRQRALTRVYEDVAARFNALAVTEPEPPAVRPYHDRPYLVLRAERFVDAARHAISDPEITALPLDTGSIDQFVDSTDILSRPALSRRLVAALVSPDAELRTSRTS